MISLARALRKDLETTVKVARRVAESGALKAVEQLGVGDGDAPKHLSDDQRKLRNRLRAHARQLGDGRDANSGAQGVGRLVEECAYEHWHRMLFARFLAESDLLIEAKSGVSIALRDVKELAREGGIDWLELASEYAQVMLPQIFRRGDPVLEIALPPETRSMLEELLERLSPEIFLADDSLGWVYQFWQSDEKDNINKSETKIGAKELPAVTQLFTEDYMVLFLLHNTIGAWWAGKLWERNPALFGSARTESEVRAACKVGDIEWTYLRFMRGPAENGKLGSWMPAAGTFSGWPQAAKDVTMLDPCMGSGHFLVAALSIFVALRMDEEGLTREAAFAAVLRDNLFGLEIDPRCTQIAAFNLAFAAWRAVGYRNLPQSNLACSGLSIGVTKTEWLRLADKAVADTELPAKRDLPPAEKNLATGLEARLRNGFEALYELFSKAPLLGSLIDPRRIGGDMFRADFAELEPILRRLLEAASGDELAEMAVAAQGMTKAAELLVKTFTLVATNVPYLIRNKQSPPMLEYCSTYCASGDKDLATVFLERCRSFADVHGAHATVTPQNWLFIKSYASFRKRILQEQTLRHVTRIGSGATAKASWDVLRALNIIERSPPSRSHVISGVETAAADEATRALEIKSNAINPTNHAEILASPDVRFAVVAKSPFDLLGRYADSLAGLQTGDFPRFGRNFWEIEDLSGWVLQQGTAKSTSLFAGGHYCLFWNGGDSELTRFPGAYIRGLSALGKCGVAITQTRALPSSLYVGTFFDNNIVVVIPRAEEDLAPILAFCSSEEFHRSVRRIDEKLGVTNATLMKVPFDIDRWRSVSAKIHPQGLPKPSSLSPDEWIFDGNPCGSNSPLHVAVARLMGFQWPRQTGSSFAHVPAVGSDKLHVHADADGIVCLDAIRGKPPARDRLIALLADAYGSGWSASTLDDLLSNVNARGRALEDWLRDSFFQQHCDLFNKRPFIWHVWDGIRDGFHALISYHRLVGPNGEGKRTLEKLIYSYLGDWIDRQRANQNAGVDGADARLTAAQHLREQLTRILDGEPPYDIFARWKPLHSQPIGWEPDINDGVRVNIRPFMKARILSARSATACILRAAPKIRWDRDRGKEALCEREDYPWFWGWNGTSEDFAGGATFDGIRWNALHYHNAFKQAQRDRRSLKNRDAV